MDKICEAGCFKVYYKNDDIRRFAVRSPPQDWCEFKNTLEKMFQFSMDGSVRLQYVDDEGERVAIGSSMEWEEALCQLKNQQVKKFFIVEASSQKSNKVRNDSKSSKREKSEARDPFRFIETILGHPFLLHSMKRLSHLIQKCSSDTGEIELNISEIFQELHKEALDALEQHQYEYAKVLLQGLLFLDPGHPLTLYNLACAESLLGNQQKALELFRRSLDRREIDSKFIEHIKSDKDLDNIRSLPEFVDLLRILEGKVKLREKQVREQTEEANPNQNVYQRQQQQQGPSPCMSHHVATGGARSFEQELQVLWQLGFTNDEDNIRLLNLLQGDINAVLNTLLF